MSRIADFMTQALKEARAAGSLDEVPVGCVIVDPGTKQIIARAGNRTITDHDPSAHAEILAIRAAGKATGSGRLSGLDLYVTLEPCAMCAAAISFARIRRLYYGAEDVKGGAVDNGSRFFTQKTCHHAPEVYGGMDSDAASDLLRDFFKKRRA